MTFDEMETTLEAHNSLRRAIHSFKALYLRETMKYEIDQERIEDLEEVSKCFYRISELFNLHYAAKQTNPQEPTQ